MTVSPMVGAAKRKRTTGVKRRGKGSLPLVEESKPEAAAGVMVATSQRLQKIKEIAEAEGIPAETIKKILVRLRKRYPKTNAMMRQIAAKDLTPVLGHRALQIIESIDEYDLATSTLKDKAIAAGILIDKFQLLQGEPTAIVSVEDRRKANELTAALLEEARRRGITIDGEYEEVPDG